MSRLRLLIIAFLVMAALSQMARLRAQDNADEPDTDQNRIYLPAVMQGDSAPTQDDVAQAQSVVRVTYRSPEEKEYFLSELDVLEENCGQNCPGARPSVALAVPDEPNRRPLPRSTRSRAAHLLRDHLATHSGGL